jgi:ferredoxin/coenzyme F420-reducing hydrogenase delta subunit
MLIHLLREWVLGHYAGFRRYLWITGVVLLPLIYATAIGGFWIHWDRLGQFSAQAMAQWLDALPFFTSPLSRNFLRGGVSDRLFSLFVFVHIGLPLLVVFACWVHVQRLALPRALPRRTLMAGTALALLALALALPVQSQDPADLAAAPRDLAFDWLLLFVHPLAQAVSPVLAWVLVAAALAGLIALPFLGARPGAPVAVVDAAHCNGCGRCVDDCPYAAISLAPHPNQRAGARLAQVRPEQCASCGICAGSCPSSTPFRKARTLVSGIDMPGQTVSALREALRRGLAAGRRRVVIGCDHGAQVHSLSRPDTVSLSLPCIANLPPAFVEYALRNGASGVVIAGCRSGGCEFRLGERWMAERLAGEREPRLHQGTPARWHTVWADAGEEARLRAAVERLT